MGIVLIPEDKSVNQLPDFYSDLADGLIEHIDASGTSEADAALTLAGTLAAVTEHKTDAHRLIELAYTMASPAKPRSWANALSDRVWKRALSWNLLNKKQKPGAAVKN